HKPVPGLRASNFPPPVNGTSRRSVPIPSSVRIIAVIGAGTVIPRQSKKYPVVGVIAIRSGFEICGFTLGSVVVRAPAIEGERKKTAPGERPDSSVHLQKNMSENR